LKFTFFAIAALVWISAAGLSQAAESGSGRGRVKRASRDKAQSIFSGVALFDQGCTPIAGSRDRRCLRGRRATVGRVFVDGSTSSERRHQRPDADDFKYPLDVVGENVEAHLRGDLVQCAGQEVGAPHPRL
jgi:hypothetical protein